MINPETRPYFNVIQYILEHTIDKILRCVETREPDSENHLRALLSLSGFILRLDEELWINKFAEMNNSLVIWSVLLQSPEADILCMVLSTIRTFCLYKQQFRGSSSLFNWRLAQQMPFAVFIPGIISCMYHEDINVVINAYETLYELLFDAKYQRVVWQSGGIEALAGVAILFAENALPELSSVIETLADLGLPHSFQVREEDHHPIQFFQNLDWNMFINHLLCRTVALKQHGAGQGMGFVDENGHFLTNILRNVYQLDYNNYRKKEEIVRKHVKLLITCLSAEKAMIEHQYDLNLFTASCLSALQEMDENDWFDEPSTYEDLTDGVSSLADFKVEALAMLKRLQAYQNGSTLSDNTSLSPGQS